MDWLVIVFLSYFVLAIVGIVDKFLLSNIIKDNRIYVFLIGMTGMAVFLATPFVDFSYPGFAGFALDIISGIMIIAALFLFYKALQQGEASIVIPLIGGGMPVVVFIFSVVILEKTFTLSQTVAVLFLLLGGLLMTLIPKPKVHWWQIKKQHPRGIGLALVSTLFFATFFIMSDYAYETQGFTNGFIWARLGSFVAVVWLIFDPSFQKSLKNFFKKFFKEKKYVFFINQMFGAAGFLGQGYAISLKGAAIVNALQGVQYVFLLVFASLISLLYPRLIQERVNGVIIIEKSAAIIAIAIGVYLVIR